jgi:hypothetical protein
MTPSGNSWDDGWLKLHVDAAIAEERRAIFHWLKQYPGDLRQRVEVLDFLVNPTLTQTQSDLAERLQVSPPRVSQIIAATQKQLTEISIEIET